MLCQRKVTEQFILVAFFFAEEPTATTSYEGTWYDYDEYGMSM